MTTSTDTPTTETSQTSHETTSAARRTVTKAIIAGLALASVSLAGVTLLASTGSKPKTAYFATDGVALAGYDVVAYFTEAGPTAGSSEFETTYDGVIWRFSSRDSLDAFIADPEVYLPAYGGYCAWGLAAKDQLFPIDPTAWSIVDGRLYLNFNSDVQGMWLADPNGFIAKADELWPSHTKNLTTN